MSTGASEELRRIEAEYRRRAAEIPQDFYALTRPANLFMWQSWQRAMAAALANSGTLPLLDKRILEIGPGHGKVLAALEQFGAKRENLAGIELDPSRHEACARQFPMADLRLGDAADLPWPDESFDVVVQCTVFTSLLDFDLKHRIARSMLRVLRPTGIILWYDFMYNNPRNPHVRGIGRREIAALFPQTALALRRITLAPPLARRIVPLSWTLAAGLERLRVLNTHYLAIIRRPH